MRYYFFIIVILLVSCSRKSTLVRSNETQSLNDSLIFVPINKIDDSLKDKNQKTFNISQYNLQSSDNVGVLKGNQIHPLNSLPKLNYSNIEIISDTLEIRKRGITKYTTLIIVKD